MRIAFCLLGTLSAAAILAGCAERRTYNDEVTTSTYDRDRGYTSGWTSGTYVAGTNDENYQNQTSISTGYQSGTQQGYRSNGSFDNTNRVSGYGASDGFNTGTSSPTGSSKNDGMNNEPYGSQPSTGSQTYGGTNGTGTTGTVYGNGVNGTGTTTAGGGYGNTGTTYEKSATVSSSWSTVKSGVAVFHAIEGNTCKGTVRFVPSGRGLHVTADLEGLKPNQKVALRINEFGDCSSLSGGSTGAVFGGTVNNGSTTTTTYGTGSNVNNTNGTGAVDTTGTMSNGTMSDNGTMVTVMRHPGELIDLESDASGALHIDRDLDDLSLVNGDNAILGRSVVLETLGDTSMSTPSYGTTTTGTRIACGVIGIGKSDR